MILNHRPIKGALFGSAFPPNEELESLARVSGPNMILFYQNFDVTLVSPPLRMIWPDATLESNFAGFREFIEKIVAPAEKLHLAGFWEEYERRTGEISDVFLLKSRHLWDISILGLSSFRFSWGTLLVVVPGENPGRVREVQSTFLDDKTGSSWRKGLNRWVEDSEAEFVLTHLLNSFPEEFRGPSGFLRKIEIPNSENKRQSYEIVYKFRNQKWQRDVIEEEEEATKSGTDTWKRPGGPGTHLAKPQVFREKGVRTGTEILINFTVFMGGVFPLGDIPVPTGALEKGGLIRINRFIREISSGVVSHAQSMTSEHYRFCRFWAENGFSVDGLEVIARIMDPVNWKNLIVLPFWETGPNSLAEIRAHCRVSDPFFLDPKKNMGLLILRDCGDYHARNVVTRHFRKRVSALVESPITVGRFLQSN